MIEGQADWAALWRELSLRFRQLTRGIGHRTDPWRERAPDFDAEVKRRQAEGRDLLVKVTVTDVVGGEVEVVGAEGVGRHHLRLG